MNKKAVFTLLLAVGFFSFWFTTARHPDRPVSGPLVTGTDPELTVPATAPFAVQARPSGTPGADRPGVVRLVNTPDPLAQPFDEAMPLEGAEEAVHREYTRWDVSGLDDPEAEQRFEFHIPQEGRTYVARLEGPRVRLNGIRVWKGRLDDADDGNRVIVTRGRTMTFITLAGESGVYSMEVDNATGAARVVAEREFDRFNREEGDVVEDTSEPLPVPPLAGARVGSQ